MRSYSHKTFDKLSEKDQQWVETVLIPKLFNETGVQCYLDGDLLKTPIHVLNHPNGSFEKLINSPNNSFLKRLTELYNTVTIDHVGVWIDPAQHWTGYSTYKGLWAIQLEPILRRGQHYSKRLGL